MITNCKGRRSRPNSVGSLFVAFLGSRDSLSELPMKLVEITSEVASVGGSDIGVGLDGDRRVVALVGEEGSHAGGSVRGVVVGEFCEGK